MISRVPPAIVALGAQAVAIFVVVAALGSLGTGLPPLGFGAVVGVVAAALGALLRLERWWIYILFAFGPLVAVVASVTIPRWFWAVGFVALLLVYWSTFRTRVPLFLSSRETWRALEALLPAVGSKFRFVDLGCGLGGVLTHLARVRPDGNFHGVELAPLPAFVSALRVRLSGLPNCSATRGSLWDCDLSQYDVVFAYLSPVPMTQLWEKARREMRVGSTFISSSFVVPGIEPHGVIEVGDRRRTRLLVWKT